MAGPSFLDIVTRAERPTFTIDGTAYQMRHPSELSMAEFHQLGVQGGKLQAASQAYTAGEDADQAFSDIIASMNQLLDLLAPDLPARVREKLNPYHVQQIIEAFTGLARSNGAPGERPSRRKSSRGSSASTAAARRTG